MEQNNQPKPKRPLVILPGSLPQTGYVRQHQLIKDPKQPDKAVIVPFSSATLWRLVKAGKFPPPVKLSERITAWPVQAVRDWLNSHTSAQPDQQKSR